MLMFIPNILVILPYCLLTNAGSTVAGGLCSVKNDHLDPASLKFISECSDQTFCAGAGNGTCVPRRCRRDEFPFGYSEDQPLPPRCGAGTFCPDEGNGCQRLKSVGSYCQLNRDEQCAPPVDWEDLASQQNFNGSVCLKSVCLFANVTFGQPCVHDNTTYLDIGPDGQEYTNTIMRDNCLSPQLYCDLSEFLCVRTKSIGSGCIFDAECETYNCGEDATCTDPPETPKRIAPWQWAVTIMCAFGAMVTTCVMLTFIHQRHRYEHYKEIQEYYFEQLSLRRSIIALHAVATEGYVEGSSTSKRSWIGDEDTT